MAKRPRRKRGDVFRIDLGDGTYSFGQVLESPLFVFFDLRSESDLSPEEITSNTPLFLLWVMKYAMTSGVWPVIGQAEISPLIDEKPIFYRQDAISGKLSIYHTGGKEEPATPQEIEGLERAAVWDPSHVVDRLNDHFAGRPCKWLQPIRPTQS